MASTLPIIHAQAVNPDVEFKIVWAYTWFDPAKEAEAANVLIEQGADVILQHTDSTAPQAAAQAAGNVVTFGQASDMAEFARSHAFRPSSTTGHLTTSPAPKRSWMAHGKAPTHGTASARAWLASVKSPTRFQLTSKPAEALIESDLRTGEYHAFTGPINKQDGSVWLADGEIADDGTLAGMNFYVEGITGDIPQ